MKKLLLISSLVVSLSLLVGCAAKDKTSNLDTGASSVPSNVKDHIAPESVELKVKYTTVDKRGFTLTTKDNFVTATLIDPDGQRYILKEVPAGSGIRLEGENGVLVQTKGDDGIIELGADKSFTVKEVK